MCHHILRPNVSICVKMGICHLLVIYHSCNRTVNNVQIMRYQSIVDS